MERERHEMLRQGWGMADFTDGLSNTIQLVENAAQRNGAKIEALAPER